MLCVISLALEHRFPENNSGPSDMLYLHPKNLKKNLSVAECMETAVKTTPFM
jgi:hypothetical protein